MKTQNSFKSVILAATLFTILFSFVSCTAQNNTSEEEVKPPKIDLHTAVFMNDLAAVKQHIAAGTDLNSKEPMGGSTALISACVFGKTDIALTLIEAGADLNLANNEKSTALHCTAFFCRPELVEALINKGADASKLDEYGSTALASVQAPFENVKPFYEGIEKQLGQLGLKFDYEYLEKTRPVIVEMLNK
jgi:hypothetical protein